MKIILLTLCCLAVSLFQPAFSQEQSSSALPGGHGPEQKNGDMALAPVRLYQKYVSPAIGGSCPMYPSCSNYCAHAVKKHGLLMGWIMTCDRLMRCGRDEITRAPLVRIQNDGRYFDPVSGNDFWRK